MIWTHTHTHTHAHIHTYTRTALHTHTYSHEYPQVKFDIHFLWVVIGISIVYLVFIVSFWTKCDVDPKFACICIHTQMHSSTQAGIKCNCAHVCTFSNSLCAHQVVLIILAQNSDDLYTIQGYTLEQRKII